MSTPLALAAVTAVLTDVLNRSITATEVTDIVGMLNPVTAKPPDKLVPNNGPDPTGLNLFLYQVTPNQGWRNAGLPARDSLGQRIDNAPLVLDLHYLLTATGAKDLFAEIVLGFAMQSLHEAGVLSRPYIRQALAGLPAPQRNLVHSDLAEQVEQIRITQSALTIDDLYKLWTGFQGRYRLTAAYMVTTVLIEATRSTQPSLPVLKPFIKVQPLDQIVIDKVAAADGGLIGPGATVVVSGSGLAADKVALIIDNVERSALVTKQSASEITFALPSPLANGLRAGTHGVQVEHPVTFGTGIAHGGSASNLGVFVLHPSLKVVPDAPATHTVRNGVTYAAATLDLTLDPPVTKDQKVVALLNAADNSGRAYSFVAPTGNGIVDPATETNLVKVAVSDVIAGNYLVRASVDGATSPLQLSNDPIPVFNAPQVTL
jgi:hypothetical protein